jgi:hypothetical protein
MLFYLYYSFLYAGWNSVVCIVAGCGLHGPGIKSHGVHSASYTIGTRSFLGVKRPGRGGNHQPSSSAEVKKG